MARIRYGLGTLTALATGAALLMPPTAAASAQWTNDTYSACPANCLTGSTSGGIVWGNRTATVQGSVIAYFGDTVVVYFDAFAGSTKVDSTTRTSTGPEVSYHFTIGDPNLVGGIDRIRVQMCTVHGDGSRDCGDQVNAIRD
jgi:hypothetical protein